MSSMLQHLDLQFLPGQNYGSFSNDGSCLLLQILTCPNSRLLAIITVSNLWYDRRLRTTSRCPLLRPAQSSLAEAALQMGSGPL